MIVAVRSSEITETDKAWILAALDLLVTHYEERVREDGISECQKDMLEHWLKQAERARDHAKTEWKIGH